MVEMAEYASFEEFASLVWRQKWILALFLLGGAVLAAVLAFTQTPTYEARTLLEVQMPNDDFLNRRQLNPEAQPGTVLLEPFLQTEVKLLDSDTLLLSVIDKLDLVHSPQFNRKPGWLAQIKRRLTRQPERAVTPRMVLGEIHKSLSARLFGQTQIIEILFDSPDPRLAADLVNTLADTYRAQALHKMVLSTTQTEQLLAGQIQEQKASLEEAENRLREFVSSNGMLISTNDKESFADARLRQVQSTLETAHDTRIAAQSQYEAVRDATPDALGQMLDSDTLKSYRVKLAELQQQLAENSQVLKPAHYRVRQIQAEIDSLQRNFQQERSGILARLKSQYETARFREEAIARDYDSQAHTVAVQMGKSIQYNELKRDLEARRTVYDSMLQKVKEAGVVSAMQASNVHVVDPAFAPEQPIRPSKGLYSAIGLSCGLLFGLLFIVTNERRKHPGPAMPVTERVDHNVRQLGTIPVMPAPASGVAESAAHSFRQLLPQILYSSHRAARPRIISVTSATHGEGRTFVSCHLATVLAETGRKVLLIDGDRINPRIHEIFGVDNDCGFTELIVRPQTGGATDTVWSTTVPNLFVSPIGTGMARLATLTHDPRMLAILDRLCGHFDVILIDTPPIFSEGDAIPIGQQADGVLLVVRPGHVAEELASAALEQCVQHGLPVIGKLINGEENSLRALTA